MTRILEPDEYEKDDDGNDDDSEYGNEIGDTYQISSHRYPVYRNPIRNIPELTATCRLTSRGVLYARNKAARFDTYHLLNIVIDTQTIWIFRDRMATYAYLSHANHPLSFHVPLSMVLPITEKVPMLNTVRENAEHDEGE